MSLYCPVKGRNLNFYHGGNFAAKSNKTAAPVNPECHVIRG